MEQNTHKKRKCDEVSEYQSPTTEELKSMSDLEYEKYLRVSHNLPENKQLVYEYENGYKFAKGSMYGELNGTKLDIPKEILEILLSCPADKKEIVKLFLFQIKLLRLNCDDDDFILCMWKVQKKQKSLLRLVVMI